MGYLILIVICFLVGIKTGMSIQKLKDKNKREEQLITDSINNGK